MKGKPDYYWRKSKEEGYPARSVFKLQEIQQKLGPVKPAARVLDLGASPGSWSLYLLDMLAWEAEFVALHELADFAGSEGYLPERAANAIGKINEWAIYLRDVIRQER